MIKIDNATRELLRDNRKRHTWIIYQVSLQGRSLAQVAEDAGVTRQCLYQVFQRPYPRMEKVVADALALPAPVLWPERYDADGLPIYRMGRPRKSITKTVKSNTNAGLRNVQKRKVA